MKTLMKKAMVKNNVRLLFVVLLALLMNMPLLSLAQARGVVVNDMATMNNNVKGRDGIFSTDGMGVDAVPQSFAELGNWYYYDNGTYDGTSVGLSGGGSFYWGVMFPAGQYEGSTVTKVRIFDSASHTGNILIYQGGSNAPGTLLSTEPYSCTGSHDFVEVTLSSPVIINPSLNLWIVLNNNNGQYVAAHCANTGNANGRWFSFDGSTWQDITSLNPDFDYTWMIRVYIDTTLYYDFEDGTLQGWTNIDADGDGNVWVSSTNPGIYHNSGVNLAGTGHNASQAFVLSGSYANQTSTALTPDNYLVSPAKAEYPAISFYACAQDANYAAEHFGVAVSTTTATASAFTMIREWTLTAKDSGVASPGRSGDRQGNWYLYSVDLSAYAGQDIWVAIRHFNCTDMFILNIDDITLGGTSVSYAVSVTKEPSNGGEIDGAGFYDSGSTCTLTATPNEGFVFDSWKKNGVSVSTNPVYSFTVTESVSLVAHFSHASYTVSTSADPVEGGSVSGGGTFEHGMACTITATPNEGYEFINWTKNGSSVSNNPEYTFAVTENATFIAHFSVASNDYNITVKANPTTGGIVNGAGTYAAGITCTVTAVANEGYIFANWTENGSIVSLDDHYSFVVDRNRELYANFNAVSYYLISASAGANGSISPQGDIEVPAGGDQTFTITPNFGCRISNVLVDGVDFGPLETYTFSNVNSNHTISAVFSGWGVEESSLLGIKVYPNPAKDKIVVEGKEIKEIQVYDLFGNLIRDLSVNNESETVNLQSVANGTYVMMITMKDGTRCYNSIMLSKD